MSARSKVTITLGRSGQVVKRGRELEDGDREDLGTSLGGRRSVRDRLGNGSDSSRGKRPRRGTPDYMDDDQQDIHNHQVGRDDLRFKLIHKGLWSSKTYALGKNDRDLRDKLSKTNRGPSRYDAERMPESKSYEHSRRLPPTRSADDLLHLDSQRKSYSGWTFNGLRHRSPDRLVGPSRTLSPSSGRDDLRQFQPIRSADPSRTIAVRANTVTDPLRAVPFMPGSRVPGEAAKPVMRRPPPNSILPKSAFTVEEPVTVGSLLSSLGLGKYAILFQAEEVDMTALRQMGDNDLKELGIPMGPRKKILLAVAPRPKLRRP